MHKIKSLGTAGRGKKELHKWGKCMRETRARAIKAGM